MSQPDALKSTERGTDVTQSGPAIRPDYGRGATFDSKGDVPEKGSDHELEMLNSIGSDMLSRAIQYRMPIEQEWIGCYSQYHGELVDKDKNPWQSQVHIPKAQQAVDRAAGRVISVVFSTEEWLAPLSPSKTIDPKLEFAKQAIRWKLRCTNGEEAFADAIKNALICGNGPMKIHWRTETRSQAIAVEKANPGIMFLGSRIDNGTQWVLQDQDVAYSELVLEPLYPWDVFLDPTGLNRWMIHRSKRFISDLWEMARPLRDSNGTLVRPAVYEETAIRHMLPGDRNWRLDMEKAVQVRERLTVQAPETVDVWEIWGDFVDPIRGVPMYRNCFATFAGGGGDGGTVRCIRRPQRNPFLHRTNPFIYIRGSLRPGQVYGRGILAQGMRLQAEIDRFTQTLIDRTRAAMGMYEADGSSLRDPRAINDRAEFKPLKIWTKRPGPDRKVFTPVNGPVPINEFEVQLRSILENEYDATTGVNEWVTGQSTSNTRKTRAEAQGRMQAAAQPFNESAQYIERSSLSPAVNMIYLLMLQYQDWNDPALDDLFADDQTSMQLLEQIRGLTLAERWKVMQLKPEIRVTGVTLDIMRQQMLGRIQQWIQMNGMDPVAGAMVDKAEMQRLVVRMLDLPRALILPNADQILQALSQAQMQAIVQQTLGAMTPGNPANANNQGAAAGAAGRQAAGAPPQASDSGGGDSGEAFS